MTTTNDEIKDKEKLETVHQKELYDQLYNDSSNISNFLKKSIGVSDTNKVSKEIEIPDIQQENSVDPVAPDPTSQVVNPLEGEDPGKTEISPEMLNKLDLILKDLGDITFDVKLKNLKQEIINEVKESLVEIKKELDEFKDKKVPKRKYYDTGGAYREDLYNLATKVLDNVLIDLFEGLPDYSLLANQITKVYDDGTAANGIIAIGVTINKDGYRYDFKVDVPLLNGILQSPLYLQRGNKIIPLTSDAIYEELESLAFRKVNIDDMTLRKNTFNNTGENILRREDGQKQYHVNPNITQFNGLPEQHTWISQLPRPKGRGLENSGFPT